MTRWDPANYTHVERGGRTYLSPKEEVCDFCLGSDPVWEYPAAPMEIVGGSLIDRSDDEFAACEACHELLEAHRIGPLVERIVAAHRELVRRGQVAQGWVAPPLPIHRRETRENVLRFMDARLGPPRRYQ